MSLTLASIQAAADDNSLFQLLSDELSEQFPPELQQDRERFLLALKKAPPGLRSMAGTHDLDGSMALDDLAWHFLNHNDERFLRETVSSLRQLEAAEAAEVFLVAWDMVKPYLSEIRTHDWEADELHEYLDRTGIQEKVDPLSERMWAISARCGDLGLMQFWVNYARKYPERCVVPY